MFFREPLLSAEDQKRRLHGDRQHFVGGQSVNVTGKRLDKTKDKFSIVISGRLCAGEKPLDLYRRRWEIESLFAAMKSRGLNLETTHVTTPERIARLVGLLALAFVWAHLVGQKRHEREPLKTKNHGWPERSLFRYGPDLLRSIMLNLNEKKRAVPTMRALAPEQPLEIFYRVVWERYSDWNKEPSHIRRKVRRMYGG